MPNLSIQPNDVAIAHVSASSPSGKRIIEAEELNLGERMRLKKDPRIEAGWVEPPLLEFVGTRTLSVKGSVQSSIYPAAIAVETTISVPALANTTTPVWRDDWVGLISFVAEVGLDLDPEIRLTLTESEYDEQGSLTGLIATTFDGENTRRYRSFFVLVHSLAPQSEANIWEALGEGDLIGGALRELAIANTGTGGFVLGEMRVFARDPNLISGATYRVLEATIEVFPLCSVLRAQNTIVNGYHWGKAGEAALLVDFNLKPRFRVAQGDVEISLLDRCSKIMAGLPGEGFCYSRAVKNLFGGLAPAPAEHPGELTRSPRGSYIVANGQRIGFTNQRILQDYYVQVVYSQYQSDDGDVFLTAIADTDVPVTTQFGDASYHKIFDENGVEQTDLGTFEVSTGYNTITWFAGPNSSFYAANAGAFVSKKAYFVPGIFFASGSGFPEFFPLVERVYRNGAALSPSNVRDGANDLDVYTDPANNEAFFAIFGKERGAWHRTYKKVVLTANASGKIFPPDDIGGQFAFVQGRGGRLDATVVEGFAAHQANINALVYYPPKSSDESWQVQFKVSPYQGIGTDTSLFPNTAAQLAVFNGAKVVSGCRYFVHSLGGGGGVFHGDGGVRFNPVSFVLPAALGGTPSYDLYAPVHFAGQGDPGPVNFREIPALMAADYALPMPGMILSAIARTVISHPRSLNIALFNGVIPLGFGTPTFTKPDDEFQYVLAFVIEKNRQRYMVIATHNGMGGRSYPLDSAENTAIDIFYF